MTDLKMECPLCDGRGQILRSDVVERLGTPDLRARFEARIEEILRNSELAPVSRLTRNFEKEVHQWNPQLPMWQRSPKE